MNATNVSAASAGTSSAAPSVSASLMSGQTIASHLRPSIFVGRWPLFRTTRHTACATLYCPGRKAPFLAVKRPVHPYKSSIQTRFSMGNAKGAEPPRVGPDSGQLVEPGQSGLLGLRVART
jgi:hypothetical protein